MTRSLLNNKKGLKDRVKYIIVQLYYSGSLLFITSTDPDRPSNQVICKPFIFYSVC